MPMTRKQRRLALIGSGLGVLALAAVLVLFALKDSIVFFNSPTDVVEKQIAPGSRIRLGGLVKPGTLERGDNLLVRFEVTDGNKSVIRSPITGILPDLFREGQGVVTEGALERPARFNADSVLAKHDETYMPKEVADALKKQGHWKSESGYGLAGATQGGAGAEMIAEIRPLRAGAGAGAGADPGDRAAVGRAHRRRGADGRRRLDRARAVRLRRGLVRAR